MAFRRSLLDNDDNFDDHDHVVAASSKVAEITIGVIIAIVIGTVVFVIICFVIIIYCVCKRRPTSAGSILQQGVQTQQTTTYSFQPPVVHQAPTAQPLLPPAGYPSYGPKPSPDPYPPHGPGQAYPPAGPMQAYPPTGPMQAYPPTGPMQAYPPTGPMQAYPPTGPMQAYPPATAGGRATPDQKSMAPPPYTPYGYSENQTASAPPME